MQSIVRIFLVVTELIAQSSRQRLQRSTTVMEGGCYRWYEGVTFEGICRGKSPKLKEVLQCLDLQRTRCIELSICLTARPAASDSIRLGLAPDAPLALCPFGQSPR